MGIDECFSARIDLEKNIYWKSTFLLSALLIDWLDVVQGGRPVVQPGRGQLRLLLRSGGGGCSDLPPGHRDHLHRHQGAGQEQKDQAAARPPW